MDQALTRTFCLDGDSCQVVFLYDETCGKHFGEYPDFEETPRYTSRGRPWVTAMQEGCVHSINKYAEGQRCMDCGSCQYFIQEQEHDLIGICSHGKRRKSERHRENSERILDVPVSFVEQSKGEDKT